MTSVLALMKDDERYVFLYDEENLPALFTVLANYAMDPELSFNWYDAFVLRERARTCAEANNPVTDE